MSEYAHDKNVRSREMGGLGKRKRKQNKKRLDSRQAGRQEERERK
jgi:hypothetical protein